MKKRACLENDVGCVVAVEAGERLAESGRARQTAGGTTVPGVPRSFNHSSEGAGKLRFYYPPISPSSTDSDLLSVGFLLPCQ